MTETESKKSDVDVLWGAEEIAREIGRTEQQTFYLLKTKKLPARKLGATWISSRKALREFLSNISAA